MTRGNAQHLAFGATVVAALLWFTAFVALFRPDLGEPYVAASVFAVAGAVVWLVGGIARRIGGRG